MNRRQFVAGLSTLAAFPVSRLTLAQAPFRIMTFPDMISPFRQMFSESIRQIGWSDGVDVVVVESGVSHDATQLAQRAKAVVGRKPDLFVTFSSNNALALHQATRTIPIVMWTSGYPVEAGVADSLGRPGKNVTGNAQYAGTGVWGKLLELLKDVKPGLKRVGVYWGYVPPAFAKEEIEPCYRELREAARSLGIAVDIVEASAPDQVPGALARLGSGKPDALLLTSSPLVWAERPLVMEFATRRRLPTVVDFVWPDNEKPSPLLTFAPSTPELIRSAVSYIARIRSGAKPAVLPIQLPARFELLVNRETARTIGLSLPQSLLLRADRVIG
jgi:putative ABC transport system substrate-binding protein